MKDFLGFIGLLILMFFIWVYTGGPERYISQSGPFIDAPAPLGTGDGYGVDPTLKYLPAEPGSIPSQTTTPRGESVDSVTGAPRNLGPSSLGIPPQNTTIRSSESRYPLTISKGRVTDTNGNQLKEHLIVENTSNSSVKLTGSSIEDGTGTVALIGGASELPLAGVYAEETAVTLPPGGYALIETGRPPTGSSFRVNKCSGYLGQFLSFSPRLTRSCPSAIEEAPNEIRNSCPAYLGAIPRCTIEYHGSPTAKSDATNECLSFTYTQLSYNSCVAKHQSDRDFKKNEWRIFLGKEIDLWRNSREIRIYTPDKTILGILR